MLLKKTQITSWGIGLSEVQKELLFNAFGDEHRLSFWSTAEIPSLSDMEHENPCVLWISPATNDLLFSNSNTSPKHLELLPKVLLLEENYSLVDFELALDNGITEIVRPPFTKKHMHNIMRRALEVHQLQDDILCMTREIMLERELLERKNQVLSFLVDFLTTTSQQFDPQAILTMAYAGLKSLFPIRTMHAALWQKKEDTLTPQGTLYISLPEKHPNFSVWKTTLAENIQETSGFFIPITSIEYLDIAHPDGTLPDDLPSDGNLLVLPISTGTHTVGILFILTEQNHNFGRDQMLALNSAMSHLAMNIQTAYKFNRVQLQANYDALTGIHNRRYFDKQLDSEIDRANRYGAPLSLILLDIDHFKKINDQHGHQVGDLVLQQVAKILANTARTSDCCVRYGGEEFAILLPHTDAGQNMILAERLRSNLEQQIFSVNGIQLRLTASLGTAQYHSDSPKSKQQLIFEADNALYSAKHDGRNCIRSADMTKSYLDTKTG